MAVSVTGKCTSISDIKLFATWTYHGYENIVTTGMYKEMKVKKENFNISSKISYFLWIVEVFLINLKWFKETLSDAYKIAISQ